MRKPSSLLRALLLVMPLVTVLGCHRSAEVPPGASAADEIGPPLTEMDLPVSLRNGDSAPSSAYQIEATDAHLLIDKERVLALEKGKVARADQSDGIVPKLADKLRASTRAAIALRLQANLPYETVALILNTAKSAGIANAAFQVRQIGAVLKTGWLAADGFVMSSKVDEVPPITAVATRSWDAFTAKWQPIHDACRTAPSGNCAYVNPSFAHGGSLRIELFSSGRGINIDFFRVGLTPAQEREEDVRRAAWLATKKDDFLQGRISREDMEEILLLGDPATQALFQFRYEEALKKPSVITATMAPICAGQRCGVVVTADSITPLMHLVTLLGAAFPDGAQSPALAFEMPWTKKRPPLTPEWMKTQQRTP